MAKIIWNNTVPKKIMWKIPVSVNFLKYITIAGFPEVMPIFEHEYLGNELTKPLDKSSAIKVEVNQNDFIIMSKVVLEDRDFYHKRSENYWYVLVDPK